MRFTRYVFWPLATGFQRVKSSIWDLSEIAPPFNGKIIENINTFLFQAIYTK